MIFQLPKSLHSFHNSFKNKLNFPKRLLVHLLFQNQIQKIRVDQFFKIEYQHCGKLIEEDIEILEMWSLKSRIRSTAFFKTDNHVQWISVVRAMILEQLKTYMNKLTNVLGSNRCTETGTELGECTSSSDEVRTAEWHSIINSWQIRRQVSLWLPTPFNAHSWGVL